MSYYGYLRYDGIDVVNEARLQANIDAMRLNWFHCAGSCPTLPKSIEYMNWRVDAPYGITDAPWYDASVAESALFAGMSILSANNMHASTYSASGDEKIQDGAYIRPGRRSSREMTFRALLIGVTDLSCHYGLTWLTNVLMAGDVCLKGNKVAHEYSDVARLFQIYKREDPIPIPDNVYQAPLITGDPHTYDGLRRALFDFAPIDALLYPEQILEIAGQRPCMGKRFIFAPVCPDPELGKSAWRFMDDVHLMEAPQILSEHVVATGCETGGGAWMEIEFTLVAGNPGIYHFPVTLADHQDNFEYNDFLPSLPEKEWWMFYKDEVSIPADDDVFQAPILDNQPHIYSGLIKTLWDRTARVQGPVPASAQYSRDVPNQRSTGLAVLDPLCPPLPMQPAIPQTDFLCSPIYSGLYNRSVYRASGEHFPIFMALSLCITIAVEDVSMRDVRIAIVPERPGALRTDVVDLYLTYLPADSMMFIDSVMHRTDLLMQDTSSIDWLPAGHLVISPANASAFTYPEILCAQSFSIVVDVPVAYDRSKLHTSFDLVARDA